MPLSKTCWYDKLNKRLIVFNFLAYKLVSPVTVELKLQNLNGRYPYVKAKPLPVCILPDDQTSGSEK